MRPLGVRLRFLWRRAQLVDQNRTAFGIHIRRSIADHLVNRYDEKETERLGPELACLQWLSNCGAASVTMSDGETLRRQKDVREYVRHALEEQPSTSKSAPISMTPFEREYERRWAKAPRHVHIVKVDASDAVATDGGFRHFSDLRALSELRLHFNDYFTDEALRILATGRPGQTLRHFEIVLNPNITDSAVHWIARFTKLRSAHFYFLPYVSNRAAFVRHLKLSLPRCDVTFPETDTIGLGHEAK